MESLKYAQRYKGGKKRGEMVKKWLYVCGEMVKKLPKKWVKIDNIL